MVNKTYTYELRYTSMKCLRESNEASPDDEVYAVFVVDRKDRSFTFRRHGKRRHRVTRTRIYTNVDKGESKFTHNRKDDKIIIPFNDMFYDQANPKVPSVVIQVMEHDDSLVKNFTGSLANYLNTHHTAISSDGLKQGVRDKIKDLTTKSAPAISGPINIENPDDFVAQHMVGVSKAIPRTIAKGGYYRQAITFNGPSGEGKYKLRFSWRTREYKEE